MLALRLLSFIVSISHQITQWKKQQQQQQQQQQQTNSESLMESIRVYMHYNYSKSTVKSPSKRISV